MKFIVLVSFMMVGAICAAFSVGRLYQAQHPPKLPKQGPYTFHIWLDGDAYQSGKYMICKVWSDRTVCRPQPNDQYTPLKIVPDPTPAPKVNDSFYEVRAKAKARRRKYVQHKPKKESLLICDSLYFPACGPRVGRPYPAEKIYVDIREGSDLNPIVYGFLDDETMHLLLPKKGVLRYYFVPTTRQFSCIDSDGKPCKISCEGEPALEQPK